MKDNTSIISGELLWSDWCTSDNTLSYYLLACAIFAMLLQENHSSNVENYQEVYVRQGVASI